MALAVIVIAELVAIVLAVARQSALIDFWVELARLSLFLIWIALASTACMCSLRGRLARLGTVGMTIGSFLVLIAVTAFIAETTWWIGEVTLGNAGLGGAQQFFPRTHAPFVLGSIAVSAVVCALLLRYFYVAHQWRTNLESQAHSRITALQARMRPHFLFNSMNTIAALTRSDPELAEQAVEDVAELMRASLADSGQLIPLERELETARVYARVEQQRLRERLRIDWQLDALPMHVGVPALTIQPLLENAIYHGVERLVEGGTVTVHGRALEHTIEVTITNPVDTAPSHDEHGHDGNRMALENIRERLQLVCGKRGRLETTEQDGEFRATLVLPVAPQTAAAGIAPTAAAAGGALR
jgi:two-component system sensor histidine kinase AlgZ